MSKARVFIRQEGDSGEVSGKAIASICLSIFGIFAIAGLIFGILALDEIDSYGGRGRGLAIMGILLSIITLLCTAYYLVYVFQTGHISF